MCAYIDGRTLVAKDLTSARAYVKFLGVWGIGDHIVDTVTRNSSRRQQTVGHQSWPHESEYGP